MKDRAASIATVVISILLAGILAIVFDRAAGAATTEPSPVVSSSAVATSTLGVSASKAGWATNSISPGSLLLLFVLVGVALVFWWFVAIFTRTMKPDVMADQAEVTPLVLFCYIFTLFAFGVSILPPILVWLLPYSTYDTLVRSPVGIVKGCVHTTTTSDWELACSKDDPFKVQWVINIGGSTRFREPTSNLPSEQQLTKQSVEAPTRQSIDANLDESHFRPVVLHGGLVVPWYFITLAIVGAAVSLARRVPEYQRRAISAADSLNGPACRELLEFQVLQVVSAPFVAITVYNIVTPSSLAVAATLGFGSGFSSEVVLLGIRAGLEPIMKFLHDRIVASTTGVGTTDHDIVDAIKAELAKVDELKNSPIQIKSSQGVVELSGVVASADLSAKAEKLAGAVRSVRRVVNSLIVKT